METTQQPFLIPAYMPQSQQPQRFDTMSLQQRIEMCRWLSRFPATTIMVFLRPDIGFNLLSPMTLVLVAVLLFLVACFFRELPRSQDLVVFAGIMLYLGLVQRFKRWREICRGELLRHSEYLGTSRLACRWFPAFMHRDRRISRFVDPVFTVALGLALFDYTPTLSAWLVFAGASLGTYEAVVHRKGFYRKIALMDGLIMSELQGGIVDNVTLERPLKNGKSAKSISIPTGLAPDIQPKIRNPKQFPKCKNTNQENQT